MDDNGATYLCDLLTRGERETKPSADTSLPMYLIMVNGGIPGAMLRVTAGGTRLGRSADNTFQFREITISRHHAALAIDSQGVVRLTDLGSTNGTFLNDRRLPSQTPFRVQDGDRIRLGSTVVLKFVRLDPCEEQFQREMFERTVRDALTGLYNRAFFLNQIGPLAEYNAVRGLGLAILMLDVDHFKRVNDTFGHDVGDRVLREVAGVLREATRTEDLVARYGGEEFVLALPVLAPDQATERAERIRVALSERRIVADGITIRVTASLGMAFAPANRIGSASALINVADRCLYQAKNAGRNRVAFHPESALNSWGSSSTIAEDEAGHGEEIGRQGSVFGL
jgi:diguanylate cyclase (GGDEF)-like protein